MSGERVILALGSNLGDRLAHLQEAIRRINDTVGTVCGISTFMETKAEGYDGADYLNGAVWVETDLEPEELLKTCKRIEYEMGRTHDTSETGQYEDRVIDIDIILYGDRRVTTPRLVIPHPRAMQRDFVRIPVEEILSKTYESNN